ncbi:hypothetical protein DL770_007753 [Monosporascus sp. CRB-9-2]|nr:hypothetical protein DL770_007753 [Monosporascus sp. CRB-9-2]
MDTLIGRLERRVILLWVFPKFAKAVFGKVSDIMRFMIQPLDNGYYKEWVEVFENLPEDATLSVGQLRDWISLFVLGINGYTQRHKDINDFKGGLAGLLTLGNYDGASLCVSQLNVMVKYAAGACACLRGNGLDHLVQDYSGPRFFVIGTNHETCKKYAWRKLGRLPPLAPLPTRRKKSTATQPSDEHQEQVGDPGEPLQLDTPCINEGSDEQYEGDFEWTNETLHDAAVLH